MGIKIDRTGESKLNNQGLKMFIREYRNYDDLDIEFEDGYISYNKKYGSFQRGEIKNPNHKDARTSKNKVGEVGYNNKQLKMEIINYINNRNITVKFDMSCGISIVKSSSSCLIIKKAWIFYTASKISNLI